MTDKPIAYTSSGKPIFDNNPSVVALIARTTHGIWCVRRAQEPGVGKLCFPGGFQMSGETWQEAAAREFFEETSMVVLPKNIVFKDLYSTSEKFNLIVGMTFVSPTGNPFPCPHEVQSVELIDKFDDNDWAFPIHAMLANQILG